MTKKWAVAVLAAGKGSRLKVETPKPILPICGRPMIHYVLDAFRSFSKDCFLGVVIGHEREQVRSSTQKGFDNIEFAIQEELNGTAGALKSFFKDCPEALEHKYLIVSCADTPLLDSSILEKVESYFSKNSSSRGVALSFQTTTPFGLGRIIRGDKGFQIVEEKDATEEQRKIQEVNSGLYILEMNYVKEHLFNIDNKNKSGEFYLSDLFQINAEVEALCFEDSDSFLGINTFDQVGIVEKKLRAKKIEKLQKDGVYFENTDNTIIDWGVDIASGCRIESGVSLKGKTKVDTNTLIESGSVIKDSIIGSENKILAHSYFEQVKIGNSNSIGPFARLRIGSQIHNNCKIGNFVETKKAIFHNGSKASHLSYIGDAKVGERTNIGCGFVTCNYDGINKHESIIGEDCFIGSDVQLIAPIEVGNSCFIAAGSTISKNMPNDSFAIARQKQSTKEGLASKFLKKKE